MTEILIKGKTHGFEHPSTASPHVMKRDERLVDPDGFDVERHLPSHWLAKPESERVQMSDDSDLPLICFYSPQHYRQSDTPPRWWQHFLPQTRALPPSADFTNPVSKFMRSAIGLHAQLGEIQQYRIDRKDILLWADDLRFVIRDDGNVRQLPKPLPTPPEDIFICSCEWYKRPINLISGVSQVCTCSKLSIPVNTPLDDYKTVRAPRCHHYIAVSYRWRYSDNSQGSAINIQTNHTDTSRKALLDILGRSSKFAEHYGYRLIWIDQFGIMQEDSVDKSLGIQAMDLVYEKAAICLALLEYEVTTQKQLDDLEKALTIGVDEDDEIAWRKWVKFLNVSDVIQSAKAIKSIFDDEYFHRSWIAQENAVASSTILLLKCRPGLIVPESMGKIDTEIQIPLCVLAQAAAKLGRAIEGYVDNEQQYVNEHLERIGEYRMAGAGYRLKKSYDSVVYGNDPDTVARKFYEETDPIREWSVNMYDCRNRHYHQRKHCTRKYYSMGDALKLLANKQNFEVADRLAILANLCRYPIRLDGQKLKSLGFNLAACIFCLSVLNGDLSLGQAREGLKYKDFEIEPDIEEYVSLMDSHGPYIMEKHIKVDLGPALFSWAPYLVEGFLESNRIRKHRWRYETGIVGTLHPCITIKGCLWHRYRQVNCQDLRDIFQQRLPNAISPDRFLSSSETTTVKLGDYLDCLWDIINLFKDDQDLSTLAEQLWLALLRNSSVVQNVTQYDESPEQVKSNEPDQSHRRKEIHGLSREDFDSELQTTERLIPYSFMTIQTICYGYPLNVFKLDQQDEANQETHFAILHDDCSETLFTPGILQPAGESAAPANLFDARAFSWIVQVNKYEGQTSDHPKRSIERRNPSCVVHSSHDEVIRGIFGTGDLPKSCFALL